MSHFKAANCLNCVKKNNQRAAQLRYIKMAQRVNYMQQSPDLFNNITDIKPGGIHHENRRYWW
ncbi:hypothetical protein PAENIP36_44000 [Paenibacillus sp. P36]